MQADLKPTLPESASVKRQGPERTLAEFYAARFKSLPRRILLLKTHSAGVGDILRSSAAWRALKTAYPQAELHLLFLTREPGYPSEGLMAQHHLLASFQAINKRVHGIGGWRTFVQSLARVGTSIRPDLIIDCEPNGIRTSLITRILALRHHAVSVGINQVPLRGLFYTLSAPRAQVFAMQHGLSYPMEYTFRDFVVLAALKIARNGLPIELEETSEGREFRATFRNRYGIPPEARILGVNIGCGTPGAGGKRPDLNQLSEVVGRLQEKHRLTVVLTGAKFETDINQEFAAVHTRRYSKPVYDLAGATSLSGLTGLIRACALFVSTDSGPYHMAVAMRVPTLAIFKFNSPIHHHANPWVRCVVMQTDEHVPAAINAGSELLTAKG